MAKWLMTKGGRIISFHPIKLKNKDHKVVFGEWSGADFIFDKDQDVQEEVALPEVSMVDSTPDTPSFSMPVPDKKEDEVEEEVKDDDDKITLPKKSWTKSKKK